MPRRTARIVLAAMTLSLMGCGSSAGPASPTTGDHRSSAASPTAQASAATRTFPPSQTAIEPGRYRWDGFERPISVELGSGWALGHGNPTFFDLFRGSDFPSVTFARFGDVYTDQATRTHATDAASVVGALAGRKDVTMTNQSTVTIGGLTGRQLDLATTQPRTPLFFGPAGDFRLDPEFRTRYRILDWPGDGILVIGIHTPDGSFEDGVALGEPVVATLRVEP
jgi:hypothetical protein